MHRMVDFRPICSVSRYNMHMTAASYIGTFILGFIVAKLYITSVICSVNF